MSVEELFWWTLITLTSVIVALTIELVLLRLANRRRDRDWAARVSADLRRVIDSIDGVE